MPREHIHPVDVRQRRRLVPPQPFDTHPQCQRPRVVPRQARLLQPATPGLVVQRKILRRRRPRQARPVARRRNRLRRRHEHRMLRQPQLRARPLFRCQLAVGEPVVAAVKRRLRLLPIHRLRCQRRRVQRRHGVIRFRHRRHCPLQRPGRAAPERRHRRVSAFRQLFHPPPRP